MTNIVEQIEKAIGSHGGWKVKLRQSIDGTLTLHAAEVSVDNRCEFGKWLHSLAGTPAAADPHYKAVLDLHKAFHKAAAAVVSKVEAGDKAGAEALIGMKGDYTAASSALTSQMIAWKKGAQQKAA